MAGGLFYPLQGEAIDKLACQVESIRLQQQQCQPKHSMEDGGTWTEVVRRKPPSTKSKNKNVADVISASGPAACPPPAVRQQRVRTRPPAILVQVGKKEFPALVHKIRGQNRPRCRGSLEKTSKCELFNKRRC